MVPLENRIFYLNKIQKIPKINSFWNLLNNKYCNNDSAGPKDSCVCLINSLIDNNEHNFKELYNDFSMRKPLSDSVWINDDFLIFTLIIGVFRYKIDRSWIKNAIKTRTTENADYIRLNRTLSNILDENFGSNDNLYEIIIVFQFLLDLNISTEYIDVLYNEISNNLNLFLSQNDFLICLSLRAIDVIVILKGLPDNKEIANLRVFSNAFPQKIKLISEVFSLFLFAVFFAFFVFSWQKNSSLLDFTTSILGILGAGFLALIKWIRKKINKFLLFAFGYSQIYKR